jgi:hypothetical protein
VWLLLLVQQTLIESCPVMPPSPQDVQSQWLANALVGVTSALVAGMLFL